MSDRIVRPTFGGGEMRPATIKENISITALAFAAATLMLLGARDVGAWVLSLLR